MNASKEARIVAAWKLYHETEAPAWRLYVETKVPAWELYQETVAKIEAEP